MADPLVPPAPVLGQSAAAMLVRDIGLAIMVAAVLSAIFARLRIPTIAAFLAAGVVIGPVGTGMVTDQQSIQTIAGLGLVLLLFLIGLEMDLRRLLSSGRALIVVGILQVPCTVAFGWGVARLAAVTGWEPLQGPYVPLYAGVVAAVSSTLVIVKVLQERGQMDTMAGRLALGISIFQDVWAIVFLACQPNFADPRLGSVVATFAGIAGLSLLAWAIARFLLPAVFRSLAAQPELMLVAAMGWCFGVGFLGQTLGEPLVRAGLHTQVVVSREMGALIAGISIASFPYSTQVVTKIRVVHDFFITLFFVGLGMQIPMPGSAAPLLLAAGLAALAFTSRLVVCLPLFYACGVDRRQSVIASMNTYPVSEFCLVILYIGMTLGHVSEDLVTATIFAFVATALTGPAVIPAGHAIHERLGPLLGRLGMRAPGDAAAADADGHGERAPDIVVLGFHRTASSFLHDVETRRPELRASVLVVDFNVALHDELRARGFRVAYGDISSPDTLQQVGATRARVVVSTIADDLLRGTSNLAIVRALRAAGAPGMIVACSLTVDGAREMYAAGADYVLLPRFEVAARLGTLIEDALAGDLTPERRAQEERFGIVRRREVLP